MEYREIRRSCSRLGGLVSATPRPSWKVITPSPLHGYVSAIFEGPAMILEATEFLCQQLAREHNGFDGLLAVAKAAKINGGCCCGVDGQQDMLLEELAALDAAHPGWREWAS